jgi:hypothetical protein
MALPSDVIHPMMPSAGTIDQELLGKARPTQPCGSLVCSATCSRGDVACVVAMVGYWHTLGGCPPSVQCMPMTRVICGRTGEGAGVCHGVARGCTS